MDRKAYQQSQYYWPPTQMIYTFLCLAITGAVEIASYQIAIQCSMVM